MNKLLAASAILASNLAFAGDKVVVYNWSEYIDESVVEQFTEETGIEVEYATFDSNEVMYSKLKLQQGKGYDIVVPSTYYVSKMSREGLLQPIDKSKLSNFGNLNVDLLNKDYDKGNQYSVPYFWGSTAISYDADSIEAGTITSWKDLWNQQWEGKLLLTDDVREVFHMALRINGHSGNTRNPEEIKQAYETLKSLIPNVLVFNSEAPREPFLSGDVSVGMNWNGEVYMAQQEGANLEYVYPTEGAVFWVDSLVIPKGAENVDNAHKFINFLLKADVARANAEYVGYATPNQAAIPLLSDEVRNNPAVFPSQEDINNGEFHHDIGDEASQLMNEYWQKLKTGM
ncbi:extracellular solute-binding protein [Oceanospirillum beijerinckii]|uniref:extracellular solute-binding protein n=1 Tax=Oceanospirillum beijerinckii TaxID=64976 RepID=UPI00041C54B0|nr:extracellular solute-binding protein [Oceanospirillum beijerinckii]MAC47711.1 spermidine/putrescine ABC transporter substrate-binding protein PotD [Oceanospirillum sp.]